MMKKFVHPAKRLKRIKLRTYISLGVVLILLPIVILSLFKPTSTQAVWMNDAWTYRKIIPITAHTGAETNKYFTVTIDTSDTTRFQSDCGDMRFTTASGKPLQYYIASGCSSASTVTHVLVPDFPAGAQDFYLYYGNPAAVNGFSSTDFTAGTGVTVGSVGSEEKGVVAIANWTFDEGTGTSAGDISQSGTTGTLTNISSPPTGTSGWKTDDLCVTSKCLAFDGSDDYVTVSDASSLDLTTNFSVSAWVNTRTLSGDDIALVNKGRDATATYAYALSLNSGAFAFKLYDGTNNPTVVGTTTAKVQTWYYVTGTYDGSAIRIYVNGVLENTTSTSINIGNQTGPLVIGKNANASDRYFSGKLDDVRMYNYALSATQVQSNYNTSGVGDASSASFGIGSQSLLSNGLVGYWKMDESAANSCSGGANDNCDSSGFGGDGAWTGTATSASGKFGNSLSLDGGGYVAVGSGPTVAGTGVTLAAWIYPTATSARDEIIDLAGFNLMNLQNAKVCFYDGDVNSSYFCSSASVSLNTWTHVLATYDAGSNTEHIYINGNLDSSFTPSGVPSGGSLSTSIGYCHACATYAFTGKLDEVRAYNRNLSAREVKNMYNWAPSPVGYWNFDEKTGATVTDKSGGGISATITDGGTVGNWTTGKYGSAYNLSGGDGADVDKINFGGSSISLGTVNTISFWVNFNNIGINGATVGTSSQISCGTNCGYMTYFDNAGNIYSRPETSSAVSVSTGTLTTGTWYHFAVVRNGTSVTFYKNGIKVGVTQTLGANNSFSLYSLTNFYAAGANDYPVDGKLDEIRVYNYDRTQQQVVEDMNSGHPTGGSPVGSYVSYWRMDEANSTTVHDYNTLNANDLTLSTSSWDTSGKINSAWKGVGTNWLSRADDDDFDFAASDSFSVSMWYKSTSATNPASTEYLLAKGRGTPPGYALYINTSGFLCLSIDDDASWTPDDSACTTTDVYDATWHHVVAQKTGTTEIRLYVDTKSVAADTSLAATGTLANSGILYLGDDDGDSTNAFNGDIDEVKVYRSALTIDQIAFDYNGGAAINFGSTASAESSQLSDGSGNAPIGWWSFDEKTGTSVSDKSGNGNTGSFSGSGLTWNPGKVGSSLFFDGNSQVDISNSSSLNFTGAITIEAWVYPTSLLSWQGILFKRNGGGDVNFGLVVEDSGNDICLNITGGDDNHCSTGEDLVTNSWQHVAATFDESTDNLYLYKNGKQILATTDNGTIGNNTYPLSIGAAVTSGGERFIGNIDDVKLYNYARTPAQIAYDYNRGGPIGWWRLDECQGSTTYDSSEKANNGTIGIDASGTQTAIGTCSTASTAWGNGATGKFNSSLNFDGTDDYVNVGTPSNLGLSGDAAYTLSVWAKPSATRNDGSFVSYGGASSNHVISINSDGSGQIYVVHYNDDHSVTTTWQTGVWQMVTVTYDPNTSSEILYVNGKQVGSWTPTNLNLTAGETMYIGRASWNGTYVNTTAIDDVRLYNYTLSATQVQKLYEGGSSVYFGPNEGQP